MASCVRYYHAIASFRERSQDVSELIASFGKAVYKKNDAFLFILSRWAVDVEQANIFTICGDLHDGLLPWV